MWENCQDDFKVFHDYVPQDSLLWKEQFEYLYMLLEVPFLYYFCMSHAANIIQFIENVIARTKNRTKMVIKAFTHALAERDFSGMNPF